jgi:hypothetical protein
MTNTHQTLPPPHSPPPTRSEDGKTFIVKNTTAFEKDIIPQFFKHNKFSSFVRPVSVVITWLGYN